MVEDDASLASFLKKGLEAEHYAVDQCDYQQELTMREVGLMEVGGSRVSQIHALAVKHRRNGAVGNRCQWSVVGRVLPTIVGAQVLGCGVAYDLNPS